ncbi:MAG: hypothetical protein K2Q34_04035 [Alphaproteobacteria bacterium]|nr:hypothetical protein [Alphaproteobacteria bacterium]
MTIIKTFFLCIFLFGLHSAKATDFERLWQEYGEVGDSQQRLHGYLADTASAELYKPNFENLSPELFKDWLNPLLVNKAERPAFRARHLLELFTNLHDSPLSLTAKNRLSEIQQYWMSGQNRYMPLSNRIAGRDEQKVMVNALDRRVQSLIGQHYIDATSDPEDIFQIIIGDLAEAYLGKAASSDNVRHRKHYKICYLVSALMVLEKLLGGSLDTLPRARDIIFARFSEKAEDSIVERAKTLMGLIGAPQSPFDYKNYIERNFRVGVSLTDAVPIGVVSGGSRALMPRTTVTPAPRSVESLAFTLSHLRPLSGTDKINRERSEGITEEEVLKEMIRFAKSGNPDAEKWLLLFKDDYIRQYPGLFVAPPVVVTPPPMRTPPAVVPTATLKPFEDLEPALSDFNGRSDAERTMYESMYGITEREAIRQMIALKNGGDGQAISWVDAYGRNYKPLYPDLFVEAPIAMPKPPVVAVPVIAEDAKRRFLVDGKERTRESHAIEDGQQLLLYEVLADGNCGLYTLSVRREAGHTKVQGLLGKLAARTLGTADLPAKILEVPGKATEVLRDASQQLSSKDYNEHVSIPTLRVLAYSMLRSNVKVWTTDIDPFSGQAEFVEDLADYRWQTEGLPTIHLMLKGAHYDHLVPATDVIERIKARAVEDTLPRARILVQEAWEEGTEERKHILQRQAADLQFNAATPLA